MGENRLSHQSNPNCNIAVRHSSSETPEKSPYKVCLRTPLLVPVVLFLIAHIELPPPLNESPSHFWLDLDKPGHYSQLWIYSKFRMLAEVSVFAYQLSGVLHTQWLGPQALTWTGPGSDLRHWATSQKAVETQKKKQKQNKTLSLFSIFSFLKMSLLKWFMIIFIYYPLQLQHKPIRVTYFQL